MADHTTAADWADKEALALFPLDRRYGTVWNDVRDIVAAALRNERRAAEQRGYERALASCLANCAYHGHVEQMRERAAVTADGFTCGACGMDGKAAAAIRVLPTTTAEQPDDFDPHRDV